MVLHPTIRGAVATIFILSEGFRPRTHAETAWKVVALACITT